MLQCVLKTRPGDGESHGNILKTQWEGISYPKKSDPFSCWEKGWAVSEAAETTHFPTEKGWIISNQSAELTAYDIYHKEVYIS